VEADTGNERKTIPDMLPRLSRFLDGGHIEIDSNVVERAIRHGPPLAAIC
jgi:Transposase IS66 family